MSDFKRELKYFNIELDHVKGIDAFNDKLHEAISKFLEEKILRENLEVVLNENLIEVRNKSNQLQTIFGCKISLQQMDENISFVVKHCLKNTIKDADEMFEELGYRKSLTMMIGIKTYFDYRKTDNERTGMAN